MREYAVRVRRSGDVFTATLREIAPCGHPEALPMLGAASVGSGANATAAVVSAVAAARIPDFTEGRVRLNAC